MPTQQLLLARTCVTHYEGKSNYTALKDISEINEFKIRKARIEHESNEDKGHFVQCRTVSEEINHEIYAVHLELCYKILADKKNEEETQRRSLSRLSSTSYLLLAAAKAKDPLMYQ